MRIPPENKNNVHSGRETMEEVKLLLQDAALSGYTVVFEEMGYDDLGHLLAMNPEELLELKDMVNMLPGHFARLKRTITSWRLKTTTPSVSTVSTPGSPSSSVPSTVGPDLGADAMGPDLGADAMDPDLDDGPRPAEAPVASVMQTPNAELCQSYATWQEARLVSMTHSSQLGCSAMLDNTASGSRRKVVRCRAVLSKKKRSRTDSEVEDNAICSHTLLWTRDRTGKWTLRLDQSVLRHRPFCNSGQYITQFELVRDAEFVKSQKLGKLSTGKEAAKLSLGFSGRMDGSVTEHTARRARNTIKHYDAKDYDDDWCKLNEWGQKYMEMNPGSRFHMHTEEDRSVGLCVGHFSCWACLWAHFSCWAHSSCWACLWAHFSCWACLWAHFSCWACLWAHFSCWAYQLMYTLYCRFVRCFVSIAVCFHIAYGCGMKISAVDACFFKHVIYKDGYLHLLTTKDGNNKTLVLAWAICETESGDTYTYFAEQCHLAGLSRYLGGSSIIFSDRMKGIRKFHERFQGAIGRCFNHIIGNCEKHLRGSHETFSPELAWALQRAQTEVEYKVQLRALRRESARAARYFDDVKPHHEVYQYAMNAKNLTTHGFKTSQLVEGMNGVFVKARHHAPYRLNAKILKWQGEQLQLRLKSITKWIDQGHPITKYSTDLFKIQVAIAKRAGQEVTSSGNGVFYVEDVRHADGKMHEVILDGPKCCGHAIMHKQPCRHMVCVFHKEQMLGGIARTSEQTIRKFWPKCFHSDVYKRMYADKCIRQPEIYAGPYLGPDELRILKPKQSPVKRGRPKNKRYRWKKKRVSDVTGRVYHAQYQGVLQCF